MYLIKHIITVFLLLLIVNTVTYAAPKKTCEKIDGELLALVEDIENNPSLKDKIKNNYDLLDAWEMLRDAGYIDPNKRGNPETLKNLSKLIKNNRLSSSGLSNEKLLKLIKGNKGYRGTPLETLVKGLDELVSSNAKFNNVNRLISDLNNSGGNVAIGARWTLRYVIKNPSEFKGKTLKFEDNINGNRRVDLVVGNIHYEFKSVQAAPPQSFVEQFTKDLKNVGSLNQLKWVFDKKAGLSSLNKQAFLDKLEAGLVDTAIINNLYSKFVKQPDANLNNKQNLLKEISQQFNAIFKVK